MRKKLCPKCKIPNFYLKGKDSTDILPIYITAEGELVPKREGDTLKGFDTESIYCLGCSWSGSLLEILKR